MSGTTHRHGRRAHRDVRLRMLGVVALALCIPVFFASFGLDTSSPFGPSAM